VTGAMNRFARSYRCNRNVSLVFPAGDRCKGVPPAATEANRTRRRRRRRRLDLQLRLRQNSLVQAREAAAAPAAAAMLHSTPLLLLFDCFCRRLNPSFFFDSVFAPPKSLHKS